MMSASEPFDEAPRRYNLLKGTDTAGTEKGNALCRWRVNGIVRVL